MKRTLLITAVLASLSLGIVGCEGEKSTAEQTQREETNRLTAEAQRQVGMPAIKNFQERKLMKQILELRDSEDLITHAYIVNLNGDLIYLGKCIGFGLPYSVQFTNPEKVHKGGSSTAGYWGVTVPQADPNGMYMPQGLSATWLMMLDEDSGEVRPVYVEPEIIVSPFPLN